MTRICGCPVRVNCYGSKLEREIREVASKIVERWHLVGLSRCVPNSCIRRALALVTLQIQHIWKLELIRQSACVDSLTRASYLYASGGGHIISARCTSGGIIREPKTPV